MRQPVLLQTQPNGRTPDVVNHGMTIPSLDMLADLLDIDPEGPADADDFDMLTVLLCRRLLRRGDDGQPPQELERWR